MNAGAWLRQRASSYWEDARKLSEMDEGWSAPMAVAYRAVADELRKVADGLGCDGKALVGDDVRICALRLDHYGDCRDVEGVWLNQPSALWRENFHV